jgi:hypothetical protein
MIKKILIFFILTVNMSFGQSKICDYCKQKITDEYLIVEDKYFHPGHFLCDKCKKPIEGEYVKNENKFYHQDCYKESFVPKCDVCGQALEGEYFRDFYGNKYHARHLKESKICDNCGRLISDKITGGGYNLSDGRSICKICYDDAVPSNSVYDYLLIKVINDLRGLGINVPKDKIKIRAVDRTGLKAAAKSEYNDNMRGYCNIENVETTFGRETKRKFSAVIYTLNKVPQDYAESTIAHELMHIWINQNTKIKHTPILEEGSCHFISYKYLNIKNFKYKKDIIQSLFNDPTPIYGDGFRKVYEKFKSKHIVELLNYLKSNSKI